ncbi:MAG TPA: NAD(P)-binding domain-containing protein [Blastocatellia bacterium]|nr:NAD(P)-binding domain-containing protein [Blastocatellia bacterium]
MILENRFVIKRRDSDVAVDDVLLEGDGLTIGRLISNDLVLNHRAVSRTHAGIKQQGGDFWLFNFSKANGTSLNGELVDRTPLADGDVIQIGPYLLQVNYLPLALSITVERQLQVQTLEGSVVMPTAPAVGGMEDAGATIFIKTPVLPGAQTMTPGGTARFQGTGLLTGVLRPVDEQALEIFWKNRKREAGKIEARTPLHPRGGQKLGKAQFNWKPTLDLRRLWRKSYFAWGIVGSVLASIVALLIYEGAFSPGPVSEAHTSSVVSKRAIADRANANSCSNCHGVTSGMEDNCISCHSTATFRPTIYDAHNRENIACSSCHTEHQGADIRAGLVSYGLCSRCHNGAYTIKTGDRAGNLLPIPHGGTIGYPVVDGKWDWKLTAADFKKRGLPEAWASLSSKDQFHNIHQMGRMLNRTSCSDCHSAGVLGDARWRQAPVGECAKCHGMRGAQGAQRQANCSTCHKQHGQSEDLAKLLDAAGTENKKIKAYLDSLDKGGDETRAPRLATASANLFTGIGPAGDLRQDQTKFGASFISRLGAVPWFAWAGLIVALPIFGLAVMAFGTAKRKSLIENASAQVKLAETRPLAGSGSLDLEKLKAEGPPYPHPVVDPVLCIGCHACVEACPHDVLAIVNGISTPVALDQCMEDTSCQVECPTNPKACIVINTTKKIPQRKVPARDQRLKTNVEGIYMIGDVSGVPLIKNAINEGAQVIDSIIEDLSKEGASPAEYDVAIVGVGPAGLSAAVIAKQRGLRYVALEQDILVSTIANYPANKYVFFKPDTVEARGGIPLPGPGDKKEAMLEAWTQTMLANGVEINDEESCKDIKREDGVFDVITEVGKVKEKVSYKARKVILAIGNRGTPMKLRVPGEEIKTIVEPGPTVARHCPRCGERRHGQATHCVKCGTRLPVRTPPPFEDMKVKYKLSDPDDFVDKKCIVVGAGNSAIEAAVDLTGFKREGDSFRFTRTNEVTLVVRSDFKGDLKLGNKMNVYDCIDAGKIKVFFRTEIKEIKETEVALKDVGAKEEKARIANDYVFALIGGEKPTKFLEGLGIKVG